MNCKLCTIALLVFYFLCMIFLLCSCNGSTTLEESSLQPLLELTAALQVANTASTPFNPYAIPVSVGLAGIAAMLEALRRKERSARKHAEKEINAPGKT